MPSSTTPPPQTNRTSQKAAAADLGKCSTPSTTTAESSSRPSNSKPRTVADSALNVAMTKYLQKPHMLTVAEIKTLLRINGKAVSGNKAELLDRLMDNDDDDDNFSMDGEGNPLPPRDMSDSVSHPLRIIPFDGEGLDLATLTGQRIQRFSMNLGLGEGLILHTDQGQASFTFSKGMPFSRYADIVADEALLEALKSVERITEMLYAGDEETQRAEREKEEERSGDLLIVEAAVGMRKCADTGEYRVVGIRCEGMEKMGFVFAEDHMLEDYYGRDPRFGNVAAAAGAGPWGVAR